MFSRNSQIEIADALQDSPIVLINGARQVGKSTLAQKLMHSGQGLTRYITLDDPATLAAAISSSSSFLESLAHQVIIDEIQRAPEIFLAIKKQVDEKKTPGQFLLTGSANVLTLPRLADSLAGRMEIHTIWPLSQGELENQKEIFIDYSFSKEKFASVNGITWPELMHRIVTGGYPAAIKRKNSRRLQAWFASYLTSILERDIRELANIEGLRELPHLLELLAARTGGLLNFADVSRTTGISTSTLKRYITLLEAVFLYVPLPAWYKNAEKRLVKSPKIYLNDTGLLSYLRGVNVEQLTNDHLHAGSLVENFVVMELLKQIGWSNTRVRLYHFRTQLGQEVDVVMEAPGGRVVGIEIKSRSTINERDFNGLKVFAEAAGSLFIQGIVLYTGHEVIYFDHNLVALPISALWRTQE